MWSKRAVPIFFIRQAILGVFLVILFVIFARVELKRLCMFDISIRRWDEILEWMGDLKVPFCRLARSASVYHV